MEQPNHREVVAGLIGVGVGALAMRVVGKNGDPEGSNLKSLSLGWQEVELMDDLPEKYYAHFEGDPHAKGNPGDWPNLGIVTTPTHYLEDRDLKPAIAYRNGDHWHAGIVPDGQQFEKMQRGAESLTIAALRIGSGAVCFSFGLSSESGFQPVPTERLEKITKQNMSQHDAYKHVPIS